MHCRSKCSVLVRQLFLQIRSQVVHIIPSDDLTMRLETRLASPYISDSVYQKLTRNTADDVCKFLASTRGDHACRAMPGQLFESFVMSRQSEGQGRTFRVKSPQGFSLGELLSVQAVIVLHLESAMMLKLQQQRLKQHLDALS